MANRWGNNGDSDRIFSWAPKSPHMVTAAMKLKRCLLLGRKTMKNIDSILKSRDITLPTKNHIVKLWFFQQPYMDYYDFAGGSDGKSVCLQCRRPRVQSPGWEDPLEKEMTTHFSTLAWRIPWTEEPGGLQSMGSQRVGHD